MPNRAILIPLLLILSLAANAQSPAPKEFEVASVRPNNLNDRIVTINVGPGDRFSARGYTLVLLMQRAYGVMDWNVTGGPAWIRQDRWDVNAKANIAGNLTEHQLQPMLQALLADRFHLRVHRDSKEMPGYALVIARGGAKIKPAAGGIEQRDSYRFNNTSLSGQGITALDFARFTAGKLGVIAIDRTGLEGLYDFHADWKPPSEQSLLPGDDPREALRGVVFSAIESQLGLKFATQKIAVPIIVIDSIQKPTEN